MYEISAESDPSEAIEWKIRNLSPDDKELNRLYLQCNRHDLNRKYSNCTLFYFNKKVYFGRIHIVNLNLFYSYFALKSYTKPLI